MIGPLGLEGQALKSNQTSSAKIRALACAVNAGTNILAEGSMINPELVVRLVAIAKRTGQAKNIPVLKHAATGIQTIELVTAGFLLKSCFDDWYSVHGKAADDIELDKPYEPIPDEHHDNPIFKEFTCPITLLTNTLPGNGTKQIGWA